jgi:hypothetical protein
LTGPPLPLTRRSGLLTRAYGSDSDLPSPSRAFVENYPFFDWRL